MEARVNPDGVLAWNPHALLVARYLPTRKDLIHDAPHAPDLTLSRAE